MSEHNGLLFMCSFMKTPIILPFVTSETHISPTVRGMLLNSSSDTYFFSTRASNISLSKNILDVNLLTAGMTPYGVIP